MTHKIWGIYIPVNRLLIRREWECPAGSQGAGLSGCKRKYNCSFTESDTGTSIQLKLKDMP